MAQTFIEPDFDLDTSLPESFPRKRWTLAECRRLVADEILPAGKYELIEGDIVRKMSQGGYHIYVVARLIEMLIVIFGHGVIQSQASVDIGEIQETSDPEPDVAVLARPLKTFFTENKDPAKDVLLAIEVSDTTLRGDTTVKARLYARAGVQDYWVVDIKGRSFIVFRNPVDGIYQERTRFGESESVSPLAAPHATILVADILP